MKTFLSREDLRKKRDKFIVPGVKHLYSDPPHLVRGKMHFLYDETGKEYLDMFAGIVTVSSCANPLTAARPITSSRFRTPQVGFRACRSASNCALLGDVCSP